MMTKVYLCNNSFILYFFYIYYYFLQILNMTIIIFLLYKVFSKVRIFFLLRHMSYDLLYIITNYLIVHPISIKLGKNLNLKEKSFTCFIYFVISFLGTV